ncbi:uncharacterized protein LOC142225415 [Haematobia irritans]|uniref:uncharacterized protein LOC142225415 n=1 Tax=Haematobia irritans TaxID=7368 RepID=UPI003F4F617C
MENHQSKPLLYSPNVHIHSTLHLRPQAFPADRIPMTLMTHFHPLLGVGINSSLSSSSVGCNCVALVILQRPAMVSTRAASYDQPLSVPNCSAMPSTTTTTTLTTTTTNAGLVFTQAMSGAITTSTSTTSSPAQSVDATVMSGINSTPNTPNFNSETAINIQRERRENRNLEAGAQRPADPNADTQLHTVINSAIGLGQAELIRVLDEKLRQLVPQLVQQSLVGITNAPNTVVQNQANSLPQNPPLQNLLAQEVPPVTTRNTQETKREEYSFIIYSWNIKNNN